ncbi:hypothetical protein FQ192_18995 [Pseudomonas sp. ANT_J12]|nr:hypothetical protein FQ192_18995 [Pseudomonas sp. ANT_J12]
MIVPTLCVGMPQRTLCVRLWKGRGASRAAFPRRAWERSNSLRTKPALCGLLFMCRFQVRWWQG